MTQPHNIKDIKNFLKDYENIFVPKQNEWGLDDYADWLESAIELLEETVGDNG